MAEGGSSVLSDLGKRSDREGMDDGSDESKRAKMEAVVPSKVLHVRNLPQDATEPELFQMGSHYGGVMRVLLLAKTRQGFIQFANQSEASAMLENAAQVPILFRGKHVFVQYSNRPEISQTQGTGAPGGGMQMQQHQAGSDEDMNCRILLLTISNVLYPITVDVISQVFSGYGSIEKIVVFVKGAGMQALVQFSTPAEAQHAKKILDGQNIYSGCCHLRIQNSTLTTLTVRFNNDKTRDFTANLPAEPQSYGGGAMVQQPPQQQYVQQPQQYGQPMGGNQQRGAYGGGMQQSDQSPVVLINHLDPARITLDALFNIFSTCGMVQKIKILFNKRDTALVQFISPEQAEVARSALTGCPLHGRHLLVSPSKHQSLVGKAEPDPAGGPPLFADYSQSQMHRFKGPNSRIQAASPSALLHVSNISGSATEDDVRQLFASHGPITEFKFIASRGTPAPGQQERKMALVQLQTTERAVEALADLHNVELQGVRVRISFSNSNLQR